MKDGFVTVAAAAPKLRVADCRYNMEESLRAIRQAAEQGVKLLVLPELGLTGATCGDLFLHRTLVAGAEEALTALLYETRDTDLLFVLGLPVQWQGYVYDCAALCQNGQLLGLVPKTSLTTAQCRQFSPAGEGVAVVRYCEQETVLGAGLVFGCESMPELSIAVEFGTDLCSPAPEECGASVICCLSCDSEQVGKAAFRRRMAEARSAQTACAYVYATAGEGESTTDQVYAGHRLIAENGALLAEGRYDNGLTLTQIDVQRLTQQRRQMEYSLWTEPSVTFDLAEEETALTRHISPMPFIPEDTQQREEACREILRISAMGLKKRLEHTHAKTAVLGLSGGLDSTLALLVTMEAFDLLGRSRKDILAVTMPCFGTTQRTKSNAETLAELGGCSFRTVAIGETVKSHFRDIGQSMEDLSVTFENGQARERTQVLMDLANMTGGMVIGTGDLSELALGWATYNGDHMSMYGVNGGIPKTLVRHLVAYCAEQSGNPEMTKVLQDILDTPVSPELLPAENGDISQKTEDLVGPYTLHDFFLYYIVRWGFSPKKVYRLAKYALGGEFDDETIAKWLRTFCRRFFAQQFKRNCLPDGPQVGSVTLSPRGGWQMPSDAAAALWQAELETL